MFHAPDSGPGLDAERACLIHLVQRQINNLKFKAWPCGEVISNLDKIHRDLRIRAAWDESKPERADLMGYAEFQRLSITLRLYILEAIILLESDRTSYWTGGWMSEWVNSYDIEHQGACTLEQALFAANSTEPYI